MDPHSEPSGKNTALMRQTQLSSSSVCPDSSASLSAPAEALAVTFTDELGRVPSYGQGKQLFFFCSSSPPW